MPDQTKPHASRARRALLAVAGGVVLGLWLLGTPPGVLGKADAIGYAVCHRISERSFHTHDGRALPLCARCTGIYLGVITTLLVTARRGRLRAGRLPGVRLLVVMIAVSMAYALDGLNSYLTFFDFYEPVYQPHNTLRLLTGAAFGVAMITVALPVFNSMIWRDPLPEPPAQRGRDLALLYGAAVAVSALLLLGQPTLNAVLGLVSVAGVVTMFALIGGALFITFSGRDASLTRGRDLALPALAGGIFALSVIGVIDLARYLFTGTWQGFML